MIKAIFEKLLHLAIGALLIWSFASRASDLFLWRADSPTGVPVFLFGSLHYGTESLYPLPPLVQRAYRESSALAVEVDLTDQSVLERVDVLGRFSRPDQLEREIPLELLARVRRQVAANDWSWPQLSSSRPWALAGMLTNADFEASGYSRAFGIDLTMSRSARSDTKPIIQLESVDEQFGAFNRLPHDMQALLLDDALNASQTGEHVRTLEQMIDAWRAGDAARMAKLVEASVDKAKDATGVLFQLYGERNRRIAHRIDAQARAGRSLFVVVGVGHLVGRHALPGHLARMGYVVQQVRSEELPQIDASAGEDLARLPRAASAADVLNPASQERN